MKRLFSRPLTALLILIPGYSNAQNIDFGRLMNGVLSGAIQAQQQQQLDYQRRQMQRPNSTSPAPQPPFGAPAAGNADPLHPPVPASELMVGNQSPPTVFKVAGIALGASIDRGYPPDGFACKPSEQFSGSAWCRRKHVGNVAAVSVLVTPQGLAQYISQFVDKATFKSNEITEEANRLTSRFHLPPHVMLQQAQGGLPAATIITWGDVKLSPVDRNVSSAIAEGREADSGIMLDFLGNLKLSAQKGKPIFRLGGGSGFFWAASYDQNGSGNLRFGAVNAAGYEVPSIPGPEVSRNTPNDSAFDPSKLIGVRANALSLPSATETNNPTAQQVKSLDVNQELPQAIGQGLMPTVSTLRPLTKTVVVEGVGVDMESAAKNAAQNALTQVVGSFIDTNTMVTKQAVIADGIKRETKSVSSESREYSQGSIQRIQLGTPQLEAGLTRLPATVTVRIDDFKAYITKVAVGETAMDAGLFAQLSAAQDNQRNLESILFEKIVEPTLKGETIDIQTGKPVPFDQANLSSDMLGNWNPAATVMIPITVQMRPSFVANMVKTLDSVAAGYERTKTPMCAFQSKNIDPKVEVGIRIYSDRLPQNFSSDNAVYGFYKLDRHKTAALDGDAQIRRSDFRRKWFGALRIHPTGR